MDHSRTINSTQTEDIFDMNTLREELLANGAWKVLGADLSSVPEDLRDGYPRALSISVAIDLTIVNELPIAITQAYLDEYDRLNLLLDELSEIAERRLIEAGYRARALNEERTPVDFGLHATQLPHKTIATRAGLGWIGKTALLVTPERGSAVRLASVLTDAPLVCGTPIDESQCGTCQVCQNNCPGAAPLGPNWTVTSRREDFFDALACRRSCLERNWKLRPGTSLCGFCTSICPYTRKAMEAQGLVPRFPSPEFAQSGDLEEILELQRKAFRREADRCGNDQIAPMVQTLEDLRREFVDRHNSFILLKLVVDRRIVGSVRAFEKDGTAYIGRLVVHPDYQRRGYGARLMAAIEQCFNGARYELFTGEGSLDNLRFYEGLGYRRYDLKLHDGVRLVHLEK